MSDWVYVAIAYTVVWGALALYALVLARRVAQTREVTRRLRESLPSDDRSDEQENSVCDAPPAP